MHGPLLIPRVPPGSFITTQISPVSAIGGAGPGCWLGDSGSSSRSVSTGAGERRGERREGDILVTLHLAPGHLEPRQGGCRCEQRRLQWAIGPWRGWHQAVSSSGPVLWLSAVIVTGQGVTVTPEVILMVSPQPSAQCTDGGEEESRAPWPRQRGSVVSRHWTLQPTAADNFGWPDSTAQHWPAACSS